MFFPRAGVPALLLFMLDLVGSRSSSRKTPDMPEVLRRTSDLILTQQWPPQYMLVYLVCSSSLSSGVHPGTVGDTLSSPVMAELPHITPPEQLIPHHNSERHNFNRQYVQSVFCMRGAIDSLGLRLRLKMVEAALEWLSQGRYQLDIMPWRRVSPWSQVLVCSPELVLHNCLWILAQEKVWTRNARCAIFEIQQMATIACTLAAAGIDTFFQWSRWVQVLTHPPLLQSKHLDCIQAHLTLRDPRSSATEKQKPPMDQLGREFLDAILQVCRLPQIQG